MLHRITPEEGSYKLGRVVNLKLGEKGIPCVTLHDGRTVSSPPTSRPEIPCPPSLLLPLHLPRRAAARPSGFFGRSRKPLTF